MGVVADAGTAYQVFTDPSANTFGPPDEGIAENWIVCVGILQQVQLNHPVLKGTPIFIQSGAAANISLFFDDSAVVPAEI